MNTFGKVCINLLLVAFMFLLITCMEFGLYFVLARPTDTTAIVSFAEKDLDNDGIYDNVSYFDTFRFWGLVMSSNASSEPRYWVRSWSKGEYWQQHTRWIDVTCEAVGGFFKPIFAPTYEVSDIEFYYTTDTPMVSTIGGKYEVRGIYALTAEETENDVLHNPDYIATFNSTHENAFIYEETLDRNGAVTGGTIFKVIDGELTKVFIWSDVKDYENYTSSRWVKANSSFLNVLTRIDKYNNGNYVEIHHKFMDTDGKIKPAVTTLYFNFYAAIILSILFMIANPLKIRKNEYGEQEISGGIAAIAEREQVKIKHFISKQRDKREHRKEKKRIKKEGKQDEKV